MLINADPGSSLGYAALVGEEDNFMKSLEKSIDYCMALNCKRLHIMSGRVGEETKGTENFFFLLLKGGGADYAQHITACSPAPHLKT